MRTDISPTAQPATVAQPATLLVSLELSQKEWVVTVLPPDAAKMSRHKVQAGDTARLLNVLHTHRARTERRSGGPVGIVSIYEAGLDGFWLHHWLVAQSIESHVVDAASIAAPRRKQRAKSDGIDGETLVRTLAAWRRGEPRVCSMVAPPTPAEEDRRRLSRERDKLMRERIALSNGIGGRLAGQGVRGYKPLRKDRWQALEALRRPDGSELPPHLMAELRHMLQRLELVMQQLKAVEKARDAMLLAEAAADSGSVAALLLRLRGLGPQFTALLWLECFYRTFANRRQVGAPRLRRGMLWRAGADTLAQRRHQARAGHQCRRQPAGAQDHDRTGLDLAALPAQLGAQPVVPGQGQGRQRARQAGADRCARAQAAGGAVALCQRRRAARGRGAEARPLSRAG